MNEPLVPPVNPHGLVLIVEDEPEIRRMLQDMLEVDGIRSIAAFSGEAALEVFRARRGEIAFVILDLTMPGIGGRETFRRMKELDAAAKVVLCTGVDEDDLPGDLKALGPAGFLGKPFSRRGLTDVARRFLGTRDR